MRLHYSPRRGPPPGTTRLALPRLNVRRYNLLPRFVYKLWRRSAPAPRGGRAPAMSDRLRIFQYITPPASAVRRYTSPPFAEKLHERGMRCSSSPPGAGRYWAN